ncbi:hypothetical protein LCGC14_2065220, partial [marine sediment metagenome]
LTTAKSTTPMRELGEEPMDVTPEMIGAEEVAIRQLAAEVGPAIATGASMIGDPAAIGEEIVVNSANFDPDHDSYNETFRVLMDGENSVILIEKDAYINYDSSTDEYVFANPFGDDGVPWNRTQDRISTAQLTYLMTEFDTNIYPTVTGIFGELGLRGDPEDAHKVWVLIHNIRDEAYYDGAAESYVAGYFGASENSLANKNMFHIDSYDWQNRIGPDGARPYLYEGVFAHEFEHMVHFDQDPDEPSWVDEGLADLAAFLCGYGQQSGHIAYYFLRHWFTSLTFWGGGLQDYGASYLFQLYLYEHYGGVEFISALVQEQTDGIAGIEATLAAFGYSDTFDEIFDAWTIANYVDESTKAGGKYGYNTLEIGGDDTWGYTIEYFIQDEDAYWNSYYPWLHVFPISNTPFMDEGWPLYIWGDPAPYTAQYYRFNSKKAAEVWVDGQDVAGISAYSGTLEWYSASNPWAYNSFHRQLIIPAGGANLTFMTNFDIEGDWDYGYVEVHDLTTDEWYTLEDLNGYTVSTDPNGPQDNPNCDPDREPAAYLAAGRWHAFTGSSGGWHEAEMSLNEFANDTIELYFRLWQDGAFTLINMFVDDISIPELGIFDNVEAGEGGWTADGWYVSNGLWDNGWEVIVFDVKGVTGDRYPDLSNSMTLYGVWTMDVDFATQSGTVSVPATPHNSGRYSVAVVANHADHIIGSWYYF